MRLRKIAHVVRTSDLSDLTLEAERTNAGIELQNLAAFRQTLLELHQIPALKPLAENILESSIFKSDFDVFTVSTKEYQESIQPKAMRLRLAAEGLLESIDTQIGQERSESVMIRMPDTKDLRVLVTDLGRIEKSISQVVVHPSVDGKVEVVTWEPGSLWIEIFLGTAKAASFIGGVAWAAMVIVKKQQDCAFFEQHARDIGLENPALDQLLSNQEASVNLQIDSEAKLLRNELVV